MSECRIGAVFRTGGQVGDRQDVQDSAKTHRNSAQTQDMLKKVIQCTARASGEAFLFLDTRLVEETLVIERELRGPTNSVDFG